MTSIQLNVSFSHQLPGCAKLGSSHPVAIWNASLPAQDSDVTIRNGLHFPPAPISKSTLEAFSGAERTLLVLAERRVFISAFNWD